MVLIAILYGNYEKITSKVREDYERIRSILLVKIRGFRGRAPRRGGSGKDRNERMRARTLERRGRRPS